jgi:hypothetical protein
MISKYITIQNYLQSLLASPLYNNFDLLEYRKYYKVKWNNKMIIA